MDRRIYFDEIDSTGTFRTGDVRLDIKFVDEYGNEYVWFPEWDDVRNLYAAAERVEEINPKGADDLRELKELKQFDSPVIDAIAEIICDTWKGDNIGRIIKELGYENDYGYHTEEHANTLPAETGGASKVRKDFVRDKLQDMNDEDYELVIEAVEHIAAEKIHIEKEDRLETVRYRLNEALKHEGLEITRNGVVQPIEYDDEQSDPQ